VLHLTCYEFLGGVACHLQDVWRDASGDLHSVKIYDGVLQLEQYDSVWTNIAVQEMLARVCDDLR
jgi:hypothetical protein